MGEIKSAEMSRTTKFVALPCASLGSSVNLQFHHFGPTDSTETAYIQASLHADEIPGLLVVNHLVHLLDKAAAEGLIHKKIVLVPFANPIGLGQNLLGSHIGRFSLSTGINFNRDWIDITKKLIHRVDGLLHRDNAVENVRIIREEMTRLVDSLILFKDDAVMKKELFKVACTADIVLDLHCDSDAVMHMYTHDRLWPQFSDLAGALESKCHLLSADSGGNCFDEACSCPWAALADHFPDCAIPMACQSATVELRGEGDVSDELAAKDAAALFRFLQRRGYIAGGDSVEIGTVADATPLTGVDMIQAAVAGVLAWRVRPGDTVQRGQMLGEIVDVTNPDAPRTPVVTQAAGLVFGMRRHRLARPGEIIVKVAGAESLEWRQGNLLTSR